jgi:hypothetical protein
MSGIPARSTLRSLIKLADLREVKEMTDDREAKIRLRAHEIWEEQGKPGGRETEFWHQAEREVGGDDDANGKPSEKDGGVEPVGA